MTGMIAGIGVKAILGSALSKVASGVGSAFGWLRSLNVWQVLLIGAVIFAGVEHVTIVHVRHARDAAVAGAAAAKRQLGISQANETLLRAALADQNKRISALADTSASQQKQATEARQKAAGRVSAAEAIAQRAAAASRQKPAPDAACGPSAIIKEQWQ